MAKPPPDDGGLPAEVPLTGGNVGRVWRRGDVVLRETGPWSPSVHRLLSHLDGRLPAVPRFHGLTDDGREVLDFMPGQIVDVEDEELTDGQLASLVRWVGALHVATAGADPSGPWRFAPPPGADVLGHNDLAPYNLCFDGDDLVGVFDWDLAAPTTARLELGFVAWNCVPLYRVPPRPSDGDADRWTAGRLRLIAATHGGVDAADVLAATIERTELTIAALPRAAAAGDVGMRRLMEATGEPGPTIAALDGLRARVPSILAHLP